METVTYVGRRELAIESPKWVSQSPKSAIHYCRADSFQEDQSSAGLSVQASSEPSQEMVL